VSHKRLAQMGLTLLLGATFPAGGHTNPCVAPDGDRPSVGLVLSGGGARGAAHIGVLRALVHQRVPVDCIAGTSMGAAVGGLYAAGLSVDELETALLTIDWKNTFRDRPPRVGQSFHKKREDEDFLIKATPGFRDGKFQLPLGVIEGQSLGILLESLTRRAATIRDFDRLRVPFRAVATDIGTGEAVVLKAGSLAKAIQASMSIPGVLSPVEIGGQLLVDGGVSNNLPMDVAREMGADVLIVVSIGTPLSPARDLDSALAITDQLTTIMTQQNARRQLATLTAEDVLIEPDLGAIGTTDFVDAATAIPLGYVAAEQSLESLALLVPKNEAGSATADVAAIRGAEARLSLSERDYAVWEGIRPAPDQPPQPVVDFVELNNHSRFGDDVLFSRISQRPGEPLNRQHLERDIAAIYGLDVFERVSYEVIERDGRTGLIIDALEKRWGPDYVQFGLAIENDLESSVGFNVAASYTRTGLNPLGGEWRSEIQLGDRPRFSTRWWQPLDPKARYFIEPRMDAQRYRLGLFGDRDTPLSVYRVSEATVSLQGGRQFGTWGELRVGLVRGFGDTDVLSGPQLVPTERYDVGEAFASFSTDTLDNRYFPSAGQTSNITYTNSTKALGASSAFQTLRARGTYAFNWGRHSLVPTIAMGATLTGELPLQDRFTLGGFLNLSGFSLNQLSGRHFGLGRAVYYYRLNDAGGPLDVPIYLGGSLELGNTWEDEDEVTFDSLILAGSAFLGMDTFLGPVFIAGGLAEGGSSAFYFFLGRTF